MHPRELLLRSTVLAASLGIALTARVTAANAPPGHYTVGAGASTGTVFDTKTKLTWQRTVATTKSTQANARSACALLRLNGAGWRLPTIPELVSLVDYSQTSGPFIDPSAFPSTPSDLFWSSTPLSTAPSSGWYIDMSTGYTFAQDASNTAYVRCVR